MDHQKPLAGERAWLVQARGDQSQADVAQACGISQQHYCNIELGMRTPSVPLAKAIAGALGFNWQRFYLEEPGDKQTTSTSATG